MTTLTGYVVDGALLDRGTGPEAMVSDQVKLYLDQDVDDGLPEFIVGTIQAPVVKVNCGQSTSYRIEYDEADLLGVMDSITPDMIVSAELVSAVDIIAEKQENLIQTGAFSNSTGTTTVTVPSGCEKYTVYATFTGSAGTRTIILDTTNAIDGAEIEIVCALPTTSDIVLDFRNATAGGTQLESITTDTSGDDATFRFGFTTVWNKIETQYPN